MRLAQADGRPRARHSGPRDDGAGIDEAIAIDVPRDAEIVVEIDDLDLALRIAALVPGQQLPDAAHRHLHAPDPLAKPHQARHLLAGGILDDHLDHAWTLWVDLCARGGHDAASERGQQLEPAEDRDDGQREDGRVELRVEHAGLGVDALCNAADLGSAPAAGLQLMQLEEQLCLGCPRVVSRAEEETELVHARRLAARRILSV
eukprot:CAMPEP_0179957428 /NCGR_PEP_ID=MMETSP0983-20121128/27435_1 /TAXON_ID=483367 /ORGANISM="non described non described, Strain CCMP 2436" /LENGTH=203 /DNA_ID=CAMNT_0021869377 /DNA_START=86 /DNA_END=698 /DNA_ORIENTATION=+